MDYIFEVKHLDKITTEIEDEIIIEAMQSKKLCKLFFEDSGYSNTWNVTMIGMLDKYELSKPIPSKRIKTLYFNVDRIEMYRNVVGN